MLSSTAEFWLTIFRSGDEHLEKLKAAKSDAQYALLSMSKVLATPQSHSRILEQQDMLASGNAAWRGRSAKLYTRGFMIFHFRSILIHISIIVRFCFSLARRRLRATCGRLTASEPDPDSDIRAAANDRLEVAGGYCANPPPNLTRCRDRALGESTK